MRRYEKTNSPQHASSFRILSPGRQQYQVQMALHRTTTISPPPSRAPEPYKLATPGRSQRKSAFAIIAEPPVNAATTTTMARSASRPTSPTGFPASGRVSPFRGRGFKGPPPRARSRPHTPPRGVTSQNSPKRSLSQIPRPSNITAGINNNNRATASLNSSRDELSARKSSSPKFGRRAVNRYTSSVGSNNQPQQQQQQQRNVQLAKATVNKRPSTIANGKLKQKAQISPQESNNKLPRSPAKNGKRFITATNNNNNVNNNNNLNNNVNRINVATRGRANGNSSSSNNITSNENSAETPSKIPLRNGSLSASREMLNKPVASKPTTTSSQNVANNNSHDDSKMAKSTPSSATKDEQKSEINNDEQELGLVDLLKQSSGATGTQSVVNTTTTTAVQPLQIDAASILAEAELVAKLSSLEKKQKEMEAVAASSQEKQQQSVKKEETLTPTSTKDSEKSKNGQMAQTMIKHFGPNSEQQTKTENVVVMVNDKRSEPSTVQLQPSKETEAKANWKKASPRSSNSATDSNSTEKKMPKKSANNNATSLQQNQAIDDAGGSSESLASVRSTDTGVSVNTVRGVSSAKEKTGIHTGKRSDEIETLSGNVVVAEAVADSNGERTLGADTDGGGANNKAAGKWTNLKNRLVKRLGCVAKRQPGVKATNCWPKMRCLACRRDPKAQLWPGKKARGASTIQLTTPSDGPVKSRWDRFKDACRCVEFRERRRRRRMQRLMQVAPLDASANTTSTSTAAAAPIINTRKCCPINIGALCRGLFSKCTCCARRRASLQSERSSKRSKSVRAKHSLTSVNAGPPLSEKQRPKLPEVLVESNSIMQGAIPCLPIPVAWICLVCNVFIPGSGTVMSGLFNLCMGQPRFSLTASPAARLGAFVINVFVGISQLFTVLFCLVGWGWSIWWGLTMLRVARKYKRFKEAEAAANDPEGRGGAETATLPAPGIPPLSSFRPTERPR